MISGEAANPGSRRGKSASRDKKPRRADEGAACEMRRPMEGCLRLVAAPVDQGLLLDPGHHGAQLGADLLDLVGVVVAADGLEAGLAGLALADPVGGEAAGLDVLQDALHLRPRLLRDDAPVRPRTLDTHITTDESLSNARRKLGALFRARAGDQLLSMNSIKPVA